MPVLLLCFPCTYSTFFPKKENRLQYPFVELPEFLLFGSQICLSCCCVSLIIYIPLEYIELKEKEKKPRPRGGISVGTFKEKGKKRDSFKDFFLKKKKRSRLKEMERAGNPWLNPSKRAFRAPKRPYLNLSLHFLYKIKKPAKKR